MRKSGGIGDLNNCMSRQAVVIFYLLFRLEEQNMFSAGRAGARVPLGAYIVWRLLLLCHVHKASRRVRLGGADVQTNMPPVPNECRLGCTTIINPREVVGVKKPSRVNFRGDGHVLFWILGNGGTTRRRSFLKGV